MIDINKKKCYIFFENLIKERKICKFSTCTVVYFNLGMTNTQCHLEIMLILHAIKSLFLYFNLCPSIEMVILLCSLIISISLLTNYIHEEVVLCYKTFCEFYPPPPFVDWQTHQNCLAPKFWPEIPKKIVCPSSTKYWQ